MAKTTYPNEAQRAASVALLAEWGIDGRLVVADAWDERGYHLKTQEDPTSREYHAWPESFPVGTLVAIRGGFQ